MPRRRSKLNRMFADRSDEIDTRGGGKGRGVWEGRGGEGRGVWERGGVTHQ